MAVRKLRAWWISVFSNLSLVIIKLVAGLMMVSMSVISEAVHSIMDLLAAVIANISIRRSMVPPNEMHAYGHGKF